MGNETLPRYISTGCCGACGTCGLGADPGDKYLVATTGEVMLAAAGGILLGMLFMWVRSKA